MALSSSITDLSVEQLQQIIQIKSEIERLESRLSKLSGGAEPAQVSGQGATRTSAKRGPRKMSAAARARIGAAAKARWARIKGQGTSVEAPKAAAAPKGKRKKGGITPEGRAKLAAAMKARWAARKKGGAAPNAKA